MKSRAAKKYCRSIRNLLPYAAKKRKFVLSKIEGNISAYLDENPSATLTDLEMRFGTPTQVAAAYVEEMGTQELLKYLRIRKRIFAIISSVVALALIIWAAYVTVAFVDNQKSDDGYYEETIW